jgi:hypothetical protein
MLRKTILAGAADAHARRCRTRAHQRVGVVGRTSGLAWMASRLVLPAGGSRLCRSDLWRLLRAPGGLDTLRPRGALGECLLLSGNFRAFPTPRAQGRGVVFAPPVTFLFEHFNQHGLPRAVAGSPLQAHG